MSKDTEQSTRSSRYRVRNLALAGATLIGAVNLADATNIVSTPNRWNKQTSGNIASPPKDLTPETTAAPTTTEAPNPLTLEGQLPYEMAADSISEYVGPDIVTTFAVQREVQGRTPGLKRFYLSDENLRKYGRMSMGDQELRQHLNDGILQGHLMQLQKQEQYKNLTMDELKAKIKSGEPLSYTIAAGYKGKESLHVTPLTIDVAKPVTIVMIDKPGFVTTSASSYNYRSVNEDGNGGGLVMEMYDKRLGGINTKPDPSIHEISWVSAGDISVGFVLASRGIYTPDLVIPQDSQFIPQRRSIEKYIIPIQNSATWASIIAIEATPATP